MDKPPYKAIGFAVIVAAILLISIFAYMTYNKVTDIINDDDDDDVSGPIIIYHGPGYNSHLLLDENTSSIHIEVDHITGYQPDNATLEVLKNKVIEVTGKPTTIELNDSISPTLTVYTRNDLETLENTYRSTLKKNGTTAGVYFMWLNGNFNGSDSTLGVSYNGTSVAIMKERIDAITIPARFAFRGLTHEDFYASVSIHEMGHLWGLVNINYTSERTHEDSTHPHHCNDEDCVMFWALESDMYSFITNWRETGDPAPPTGFCPDCIFDMQKIGLGDY